jgi:hypothetical protein
MSFLSDISFVLRRVWWLFLHENGFAWSVAAVFVVAAIMFEWNADAQLIAATIALGCLTVLIEFNHDRGK